MAPKGCVIGPDGKTYVDYPGMKLRIAGPSSKNPGRAYWTTDVDTNTIAASSQWLCWAVPYDETTDVEAALNEMKNTKTWGQQKKKKMWNKGTSSIGVEMTSILMARIFELEQHVAALEHRKWESVAARSGRKDETNGKLK